MKAEHAPAVRASRNVNGLRGANGAVSTVGACYDSRRRGRRSVRARSAQGERSGSGSGDGRHRDGGLVSTKTEARAVSRSGLRGGRRAVRGLRGNAHRPGSDGVDRRRLPPVRGLVKATRKGTRVVAGWKVCGEERRVRLRGRIDIESSGSPARSRRAGAVACRSSQPRHRCRARRPLPRRRRLRRRSPPPPRPPRPPPARRRR